MNAAAVAYIRLDDRVETPEKQERAIGAWAAREAIAIRSWQLDVGVAADTPIAERPGLLAAYAAIRETRAGILVAANAQRFAHDQLVAWLIEHAALLEGAAIRTADGSRTRADAERTLEPNVGYTRGSIDLARAYGRVVTRARVRNALAEKKARGERVGNIAFGYRLDTDGIHVIPDEAEQAVVADVRRLRGEGLSQRAIAAKLASDGVRGRTGTPLGQTQIANILRSPA